MGLEYLAHVHARRHAQRIQNNFDRRSVRQIRHVFFRQDARDNALVTVSPGHLVAYGELALHGDEDFDHLNHARAELVALTQLGDLLFVNVRKNFDLPLSTIFVFLDFGGRIDARAGNLGFPQSFGLDTLQHFASNRHALRNDDFAIDRKILRQLALFEQLVDTLVTLFMQDANFVFEVAAQTLFFFLFDRHRALILLLPFAREDLNVDHGAINTWRRHQRGVFDVGGLLTKDRAQQFLFRGQLGFALGGDFADQNRAGFNLRADANDSALV